MFIAMNRFKVNPGSDVPGFVEFHLLKGPKRDDHTLYSSHTVWRAKADFEAWTRLQPFHAAHAKAGNNSLLYSGHPEDGRIRFGARASPQGAGGVTDRRNGA
jgi:Antibiotic biosynthesis monooxygenase